MNFAFWSQLQGTFPPPRYERARMVWDWYYALAEVYDHGACLTAATVRLRGGTIRPGTPISALERQACSANALRLASIALDETRVLGLTFSESTRAREAALDNHERAMRAIYGDRE